MVRASGWAAVLVAALAAGGCSSDDSAESSRGSAGAGWMGRDTVGGARAEERPASSATATVITVPPEASEQLHAFVNRRATLIADRIEVDASRTGFLAASSIVITPDAVERTEEEDAARGITTITLRRRADVPMTENALPKVRFGDGLEFMAFDSVTVRYRAQQNAERPIWLIAVGTGQQAAYAVDGEPSRSLKGSVVTISGELFRDGAGYRFEEKAEAKP